MKIVDYMLLLFSFTFVFMAAAAARTVSSPAPQPQPDLSLMTYHNGPVLAGPTLINLIWYGNFTSAQRSIIVDFISSLSSNNTALSAGRPTVASWWATTQKLYLNKVQAANRRPVRLSLGSQIMDEEYSVGRSIRILNVARWAAIRAAPNSITVFLTASDVTFRGFCSSRCGSHGSSQWGMPKGRRFTFILVGDSSTQCPGYCAWPFHQPIYGPQSPPLVSPNGDVGVDGLIINLATLLAGTVTNPYGNGFYQGAAEAPLEAASACAGVYGKGAYPGYAGELLVDAATGGSYNAEGVNSRKYLLPALFDPATSQCSTLV